MPRRTPDPEDAAPKATIQVSLVVPELRLPSKLGAHRRHELVCVMAGSYTAHVRNQTWEGGPGDLFYYPAGVPHHGEIGKDRITRLLCVQWTDRDTSWREPRPFITHDSQGRVLAALSWMRDASPPSQDPDIRLLRSLLHALLHEVSNLRSRA